MNKDEENTKKKDEKIEKSAVFIDAGHYHYVLYNKWRINYEKFIKFIEGRGYLVSNIFYYEGMPTLQSFSHREEDASYENFNRAKKAKKKYFQKLRSFNFIVRHKPVHRVYDHVVQKYKFKCNFDVELTIDAIDTLFTKTIDIFILCSGDGDFLRLVKHLKGKNKKVLVIGIKEHINEELMEIAHEVILLDDIKTEIEFIK